MTRHVEAVAAPAPGQRRAHITLPHSLSWYIALVIAALFLAALATQAVRIGTGRDYVFGLIPKFDPAAVRNIPAWFTTIQWAIAALSVALFAGLHRRQPHASSGWWWLAVLFALLSADALMHYTDAARTALHAAFGSDSVFVALLAAIVVPSLVVIVSCARDLGRAAWPRFPMSIAFVVAGMTACGLAERSPAGFEDRVARALMLSGGSVLELAGLTMLMAVLFAHLRASRHLVIEVDRTATSAVEVHPGHDAVELRISTRRLRLRLALLAAAILLAGLVAQGFVVLGWNIDWLARLVYADLEGNVPTWYSTLLLLACALVVAAIAGAAHHAGHGSWGRWALLGLFFLALSADEPAGIHELTVFPLRALLQDNTWLRYPLILPGLAVAGAVIVAFASLWQSMPQQTRNALRTGGVLFAAGALGIETIGGWFDPVIHGESLTYVMLATLEESFEIAGVTVVLIGLCRHTQSLGALCVPRLAAAGSETLVSAAFVEAGASQLPRG